MDEMQAYEELSQRLTEVSEASQELAGLLRQVLGRQHAIESLLLEVAHVGTASDPALLERAAWNFDETWGRHFGQGSPSRDIALAAQDHLRVLIEIIKTRIALPPRPGEPPSPRRGGGDA